MAYAGVAVIACVGVLCAAPKAVAIAVCLASAAFFSAAVTFRHARRVLLALGVVAASATTLFLVAVPVAWRSWLVIPQGLGGIGERALTHLDLSVRSSGPAVLGGMFGWAGLGWLLAGLLICFAVLVAMADAKKVGAGRAVLWAITMLLSIAALLAPGGLFAPAFTIVAGFVWGLAPTMLGIRIRPRSGLLLLLPMLILTAIMGVVDNDGLLAWAVGEMGGTDKTIHATAGLLLTLGMAWFFGGRRVLPGLIAITIGGLIGGAGEGLQGMVSRRPMEWADWGAHAIGTGVAAVLYFLALGSRLAESPDAQARQHALRKYEG